MTACKWASDVKTMLAEMRKCVKERKRSLKRFEERKRFIIMPLILDAPGDESVGHQNMLIADMKNRTLERFEPVGSIAYDYPVDSCDIDDVLIKFTERRASPFFEFTYLPPMVMCPRFGPQYVQEAETIDKARGRIDGFCVVWSYWYADLRLQYPDVPQLQLVTRAMAELRRDKGRTLTDFIIAYASFFEDLKPFLDDEAHVRYIIQQLS